MKVLVIDDEADIFFLFNRILDKRHLKAGYAYNLEAARKSIESEVPSLVFLDNCLPDGQGMDFIPYLKRNYPSTRIVMVTANDSVADRTKALQLGADEFLGKPLSLKLINKALDSL